MITIGDLRLRYPEFSDEDLYPDNRIQLFIDDAVLIMKDNNGRWLDYYNLAQSALVAHLLELASNTEGGGDGGLFPISKQAVDDVLIESAINPVDVTESLLFSTTYGRVYYKYLRKCFTTMIAI